MSVSGIIERDEMMTALRLVSRGKSTGVFLASTAFGTATIGFRDGEILFASSTFSGTFGDLVVEQGLVSRERLDAALWVQREDKEWRALGQVLLDVKVLTLEQIENAIETQIARVLDEILRWDNGTFRFEHREPEKGAMILPRCRDLGQYEVRIAMRRAGAEHVADSLPA
jgi:hypothetical protein